MSVNKCLEKNPDFGYDEACLDVYADTEYKLFSQYLVCVNCKFNEMESSKSYLFETKHQFMFQAVFDNKTCNKTIRFNEHGRYGWNITKGNCSDIYVKEAGDNAYLPILGAFIVLLCFGIVWNTIKYIYKHMAKNRAKFLNYFRSAATSNESAQPFESDILILEQASKRPGRMISVDVFRGFCILSMIFFNYGGGRYWCFSHSDWDGLNFPDLIMPWFMWLIGYSITLSLHSRLRKMVPRRRIAIQVIKRSCILFFIGLVLGFHDLKTDFLPFNGVLQRLGIGYLFVGLLETIFIKVSTIENFRPKSYLEDIIIAWPQWVVIICVVAIHTCLTFFLPVPGCPTGYLGPGGLLNYGLYENCTGGASAYIDQLMFGTHMMKFTFLVYGTTAQFDVNGFMTNFTGILIVYMGVQAARILYTYNTLYEKIIRWILWSAVTGIVGGILCNFLKNDGVIPINRFIFSLSLVLVASSMAFLIESVLHVLVDITKKWGGSPFLYPGMNSIFIWVGHIYMRNTFPFTWTSKYNSHTEFLAMNLWASVLWLVISFYLYKRNVFFKI